MNAPVPTPHRAGVAGELAALVVGATGLVGAHLLPLLAADPRYGRILVLARRPLPPHLDGEGVETHVVDFDAIGPDVVSLWADSQVDHVFCALGTTMRAAGTRERFRRVDRDYPAAIARLGRAAGARHFSLVSALGADPRSRVFYSRVKGEAEAAVRETRYPSGAILRPSIIAGQRARRRPLERVGQVVAALIPGRYRSVKAGDMARVMVELAVREEPGWRVVESEEIRRIAPDSP